LTFVEILVYQWGHIRTILNFTVIIVGTTLEQLAESNV